MVVYEEKIFDTILAEWSTNPADLFIAAPAREHLLETVNQIRYITPIPVVMIVPADTAIEAEIALFEAGADLVLKRPYAVRTLVPQLRNLAQRERSLSLNQLCKLQTDSWHVDPKLRAVRRTNGLQTLLSQREFELFFLLHSHQGEVLTKSYMIEGLWGYSGQGDESILRSLVKQLRRKIEPTPEHPQYLISVQGVGYQLL